MDKQPPNTGNLDDLLADTVPTLETRSGSGDIYLPASHIQLLEQIEHLSRYSHFIQIITGVSGIGKTTLLQQFYPNADDSAVHACCIQALPGMNASALLAELTQQLNINIDEPFSAAGQLQNVIEHAQLLQQLSRQMLIVIDDAEQLALDALELLFNQLSTLPNEEIRPHIVLFAAPQIKQSTAVNSLAEIVESSCHFVEIPPLNNDSVIKLLEQCYSAVTARLDDSQKQRIVTDSLGLPGRIPRVLESLTSIKPVTRQTQPATPSKRTVSPFYLTLSLILIVAVAGGIWLAVSTLPQQKASPLANVESDRVRLELSLPAKSTTTKAAPQPETVNAPQGDSFEQRLAQARAALESEQAASKEESEELASSTPAQQQLSPPAAVQLLELAPIKELKTPQETPAEIPTTDEQQPAATLVLKLPELPEPATTDVQPSTTEPQPAAAVSYFGDGQALLGWKPQSYTLQMLGARRQESVLEFIASMPEPDKLFHFSTIYKEKPWYVVVYGQYPDREAAMTARGELPAKLRSQRPWARSIQGVQEDIRRDRP